MGFGGKKKKRISDWKTQSVQGCQAVATQYPTLSIRAYHLRID